MGSESKYFEGIKIKPLMIKEPELVYMKDKRQGEYTIEDYYALPDEKRMELIDGVFYDMATPTLIHQVISSEIFMHDRSPITYGFEDSIPVNIYDGDCVVNFAEVYDRVNFIYER